MVTFLGRSFFRLPCILEGPKVRTVGAREEVGQLVIMTLFRSVELVLEIISEETVVGVGKVVEFVVVDIVVEIVGRVVFFAFKKEEIVGCAVEAMEGYKVGLAEGKNQSSLIFSFFFNFLFCLVMKEFHLTFSCFKDLLKTVATARVAIPKRYIESDTLTR